jgi:hypothetical protein
MVGQNFLLDCIVIHGRTEDMKMLISITAFSFNHTQPLSTGAIRTEWDKVTEKKYERLS